MVWLAAPWNDRTARVQQTPAAPVRPAGPMTSKLDEPCVGSTQSTWWTAQGVAKHCSLWAGSWPVPASHDMDGEVLSHCSPSCHHLHPVGCYCARPPEHGSAPALVGSRSSCCRPSPTSDPTSVHNCEALCPRRGAPNKPNCLHVLAKQEQGSCKCGAMDANNGSALFASASMAPRP